MIRIVFFSAAHPPFDKRVFDKEARSLAEAGFQVSHVCPNEAGKGDLLERRDGVDIHAIRRIGGRFWRLATLFRTLRVAAALRPHVLHCNEVDSWFLAVLVAPFIGARVVFDAHEDYHGMVGERLPRPVAGIGRAIFGALVATAAALTWRIVLAKDSIMGDYQASRDKVVIVKNFGPIPNLLQAQKAGPPPLRIVHLGLIGRKRGWPQLLDALAQCSDIDFQVTVAGEFNDNSEPEFRSRLKELNLESRVVLVPWMPYSQAFELLVQSHVGLVLFQPGPRNHVRALPHKMFDYMAARCAVIAPAFALEVASIIRDSGAGPLVDPSKPEEIAKALRLLADDDVREGYASAGRRAVESVYNWPREAAKLISMYSELQAPMGSASTTVAGT
ncbi:glycosyltransferase [Phenylobacterium sp.]|uniref:glycosyltransferase n=1 Tax=Phenylobacterium sp. TaxID=1871053 RepID=UPI0030F399B7